MSNQKKQVSAEEFKKRLEMEQAQLEWNHYQSREEAKRRALETVSAEYEVVQAK